MFALRSDGVRALFHASRFTCLLHSSATGATISQTHFMVDYLIDSVGLSTEEAISASTKVSHLKSTEKPDLVLNFFKKCGLDNSQIKKIVSSAPKMLLSSVDKILEPRFKFFQDLGFSALDLGKLITENPVILHRRLDTQLIPSIDYLKKVLGSDEKVVECIKRCSWLLVYPVFKRMPPNLLVLQNYGLPDEKIGKLVLRYPRYVMYKPEWLEDIARRVEVELEIPRDKAVFFLGILALASMSKSTLEMKFGTFRSFGWSDSEILTLARSHPRTLTISEVKICNVLNFLMKEHGYTPAYLASRPILLMSSLEKRVIPRKEVIKILKENNIGNYKLERVLQLSELNFVKKIVLRYMDAVPDLYETYTNSMK